MAAGVREPAGSARLELVSGVALLREEDAVLEATVTLVGDKSGRPVTRRGPDGSEVEVYRYDDPRQPEWPEAEFIVGNPPFIGGKRMRDVLGDTYVEALWKAHPA